jgi:uncharacterized Zn-finger protein
MANENIDRDMRACEKAGFGVSYGKWRATLPYYRDEPQVSAAQVSGKVRTCEYCGKQIVDKYNRNRRFCDDNCRSNARYKRLYIEEEKKQKKCEYCGKLFEYKREKARYCSDSWSAAAYYYRKKEGRQNEAKKVGHD